MYRCVGVFLPLRLEIHLFFDLFCRRRIMKFERNMSFSVEEFSDGEVLLYTEKLYKFGITHEY